MSLINCYIRGTYFVFLPPPPWRSEKYPLWGKKFEKEEKGRKEKKKRKKGEKKRKRCVYIAIITDLLYGRKI